MNHFRKRKNLGIQFWIIFGREKTSEFRSESFSEEKLWKKTTFVSCFVKLHYFAEFLSVSFRVTEWTLPKYSESHGISTLFRGIMKTVPSLFRGIFSKAKFQ
jgi:hypothetical protein